MFCHGRRALLVAGALLALPYASASAQEPPWGEGPGDIVITRDVPRQNAALVGEPGRPTLVNPRTAILGASGFRVSADTFARPLTDLEADTVRATRSALANPLGTAIETPTPSEAGEAAFVGSSVFGGDRTGLVGGTVSGAMGAAGRQIQGVLSDALGRGRL